MNTAVHGCLFQADIKMRILLFSKLTLKVSLAGEYQPWRWFPSSHIHDSSDHIKELWSLALGWSRRHMYRLCPNYLPLLMMRYNEITMFPTKFQVSKETAQFVATVINNGWSSSLLDKLKILLTNEDAVYQSMKRFWSSASHGMKWWSTIRIIFQSLTDERNEIFTSYRSVSLRRFIIAG